MFVSTSKWFVVITCALGALAVASPATKVRSGSDDDDGSNSGGSSDEVGGVTATKTTVKVRNHTTSAVDSTVSTLLTTVSVTSVPATIVRCRLSRSGRLFVELKWSSVFLDRV